MFNEKPKDFEVNIFLEYVCLFLLYFLRSLGKIVKRQSSYDIRYVNICMERL